METSGSSDWFDEPVERWRVLVCPLGVPLGTGLVSPREEREIFDIIVTVALRLVGNLNFRSPTGLFSSMSVSEVVEWGVRGVRGECEGGVAKVEVSEIPVFLRPRLKSATCLFRGVTPTVQLARRWLLRDLRRSHHFKDIAHTHTHTHTQYSNSSLAELNIVSVRLSEPQTE